MEGRNEHMKKYLTKERQNERTDGRTN